MIWNLAWREAFRNWRFTLAFTLNLGLGFFGFIFLGSLNGAIQDAFASRSRALLAADLSVSALRELSAQEEQTLNSILSSVAGGYEEARAIETYSMLTKDKLSRLVDISAVGEKHPLYGEIRLTSGTVDGRSTKNLFGAKNIWIAPELAAQMSLKVGDPVEIGGSSFLVSEIVEEDSGNGWRGSSLAPRIYMSLEEFKKLGLTGKGSRIGYVRQYRLPPSVNVEELAQALNQGLSDPEIRVRTHADAAEQASRPLQYLGDYLGLVSLVGLFLSAVGAAYLFQSFLYRRVGAIATLKTLGLSAGGIVRVYLVQLALLSAVAATFAFALSAISLTVGAKLMESYLAFEVQAVPQLHEFFIALVIGLAVGVLACLPFTLRVYDLKPVLLFQESAVPKFERSRFYAFLPLFALFFALSVWQAHSWRIGSFFFFGMLAGGLILLAAITVMLKSPLVARVKELRYLERNRVSTASAFLAVGIGALLIQLLPQLQRNIESEIERPESSALPSLFLFDIQEEQATELESLLKREGAGFDAFVPMVRARLESINGDTFKKESERGRANTREEEQSARSRNRGYNLTYREKLSAAEDVVEGKYFSGPYSGQGMPEISLEHRFAERMGLKLGDKLEFDVQGIAVSGIVTSLRKVKWTSFQPNFFIVFQPGVLDGAPKTFLGTIKNIGLEDRASLQNVLVRGFPNVSIIDVTALVERLLEIFGQMAIALRLMAAIAVFTGLVVLFSIVSHQARLRRSEIQLWKVLGAGRSRLIKMFWIEFGLLGLGASLLGVFVSLGLSYAVSYTFFDSAWSFSVWLPLASIVVITSLTLVTTFIAVQRTLKAKPAELLAESQV